MKALSFSLVFVVIALSAIANAGGTPVEVHRDQAIVQVNGIVCSFCAYGTEKNLAQLDFLDKTQFGGDGVLIDIQAHRITLAIQPDRNIDVSRIYTAIKKGGYDPITFYLNIQGQVVKENKRFLLTSQHSGQQFEITGRLAESLLGDQVEVTGQLDATLIPDMKPEQPLPLIMSDSEV